MVAVERHRVQNRRCVIEEKPPIERQVIEILWMLGRFEQDRFCRAADRFLEEIEPAHPLRDVGHRSAVVRPERILFVRRVEGEASQDIVRQVEGPDIPGAGFRIPARDRDVCVVGRESDLEVGTRFANRAERFAFSVEPGERGCLAGRRSGSVHEHAGLRHVKGGSPAARHVRDVFGDENGFARQTQPRRVEGLRQEGPRSLKNQEAGRRIGRHRLAIHQPYAFRRIERPDDDRRLGRLQVQDRIEEVSPIRQKVRPPVAGFLLRLVQLRDRHRFAAGGRHPAEDASV